jgi:hypothetical protein
MSAPKDEDGVTLKNGDYITFTFGIPPTAVLARITKGATGWGVECVHPIDVKPKRQTLTELTKYYQIWKASNQRIAAALRDFAPDQEL